MTHTHYCGCGASWSCGNEGCTEDDVCPRCAGQDDAVNLEDEEIYFSSGEGEVSALKRWRSLGGSGDEFFKFSEDNPSLEGIWRGTQKGKFGENGVIETPDGIRHVFTLSTMLKDLLKVPEGVGVKVTWLGMGLSKAGNQFHRFQILVESDEEGGESGGDVPF